MKKSLLILMLTTIANFANAQIVNIPDINFKAYLVGNSAININGDAEIQLSEANAFTGVIDCSGKNIKNLTGIETFKNITTLWCYNNQLTNLNITQNTALIDLQCNENGLTSLDLSKNVALKTFFCHINPLTVLDVSKNIALENFYCYRNQLTHLDVSKNKVLINLQCDENWLTSLDVTNNITLETLMCHINQLTVLDVSKNLALKTLFCYENQLTHLDVSKNLALEKLYCSLNKIIDLDISKNIVLKSLVCNWNQLSRLNLKNGNNSTLQTMAAKGNPNLGCIQVDNVANSHSYSNWAKDATASYNTDCNYMSAKDNDKKEILLYPNPTADIINFSEKIRDVRIIDFTGKLIKYFSNDTKSVDVSKLAKGTYMITFKTNSGKVYTQKFIKL